MTLLMPWILPTHCHQKADPRILFTVVKSRILLKQSTVLPPLKDLGKKGARTGNLGVPHEYDVSVYSSNEVDVIFMLQATNVFIKNQAKPSPFHCVSFYNRAHLFSAGLRQAHQLYAR